MLVLQYFLSLILSVARHFLLSRLSRRLDAKHRQRRWMSGFQGLPFTHPERS
jgi:hypothetical protein